jgi:hypothetical protein
MSVANMGDQTTDCMTSMVLSGIEEIDLSEKAAAKYFIVPRQNR